MRIPRPHPIKRIKLIAKGLFEFLKGIKKEDLYPRALFRLLIEQMRDPYKKLRFFVYLGTGLITVIMMASFGVPLTSGPPFCVKCHHTKANYDWYKKTAHQNITCYGCHEPPGVHVILKAKITEGPKDIVFESFDIYNARETNQASHYAAEIKAAACQRCHDMKVRFATPTNGIKIDHDAHLKRGVNCTRCHNRIGHKGKKGYIDWMSMTDGCFRCHSKHRIEIDQAKPGVVKFVEVGKGGHIDFPTPVNELSEGDELQREYIAEMAEEYGLHGEEKEEYEEMLLNAPRRCDTCHTPDFDLKPRSHKVTDWAPKTRPSAVSERKRWQHARIAKPDVTYCYKCHLQKFCIDCHGTTMPHPRPYKDRHGAALLASIEKDKKPSTISPKFTFVNLQPVTTQLPVVRSSQEVFCFRCHVEKKFCQNCHGVFFPHEANWRKKHGKVAEAKLPNVSYIGKDLKGKTGRQACFTCHRPQFCDGCHGGVKMPHSDTWFKEHRRNLRTNPTKACLNCHPKFSCERCHSVHKVHRGHTDFNYSKFGNLQGQIKVIDPTGVGK